MPKPPYRHPSQFYSRRQEDDPRPVNDPYQLPLHRQWEPEDDGTGGLVVVAIILGALSGATATALAFCFYVWIL